MLTQKFESLNKRRYLQMLALAIVGYYGFVRIFQDIWYRGKFTDLQADYFSGYIPLFEPLEIPFYFLGFLVIPVIAWFLAEIITPPISPLYKGEKKRGLLLLVLVFVILVAVIKIGKISDMNFSQYVNYLQTKGLGQALWLVFTKRLYVLRLMVGTAVFSFIVIYLLWKERWAQVIRKYNNSSFLKSFEPFFFVLLALIVFHPNLPYEEHHYNFVIGTVNDMLAGKQFLYETWNQYGVINIYFLQGLFEVFGPLTYEKFSFIISIFYFLYYLCIYFFIRKWLSSQLFAYLGTGVIMAVTYFLQVSPTLSANFYPGFTPFRFGLFAPTLLLILSYIKRQDKFAREFAILLSSFAIFWNWDSGAYLALATFITLAYMGRFWRKIFFLAIKFAGYTAGWFLLINIASYLATGSIPNWVLYFQKMFVGAAVNPLPLFGFFEGYIFVYLAVLLSLGYTTIKRQNLDPILIFLAVFGVLFFTYYVNNSEWNVLYHIAVPLILLVLYYSQMFPQNRLVFSIFSAVVLFSLLIFLAKVPVEFSNRDYRQLGSVNSLVPDDEALRADAEQLRKNYPRLDRWPILHQRSAKLLIYGNKTNYFNFYSLGEVPTHSAMQRVADIILNQKPEYLFIEREKNNQVKFVEERIIDNYQKNESLNTLDVYQRKS